MAGFPPQHRTVYVAACARVKAALSVPMVTVMSMAPQPTVLTWRCGIMWGTGSCDVFCCWRRRAVGSAKGPRGYIIRTAQQVVGYLVHNLSWEAKRRVWLGCQKALCDTLGLYLLVHRCIFDAAMPGARPLHRNP